MSFESLRAYQAAMILRAEVDKLGPGLDPRFQYLYRHVDEAVDSVMNNLAEGNTSIYKGVRVRFYDVAAGSAREARSGLQSLSQRGAFKRVNPNRAITLTFSVSKLIKSLIARENNPVG